ncbi:MAG: hypothetical protein ACE5IR_25065 [bacterium]
MKKAVSLLSMLIFALANMVFAQTSGVLWIKPFSPGSSNLDDTLIDRNALATLDSLMQNDDIEVTFLGAADSLRWKMNGRIMHSNISEAWNDAKRLGRARVLRARYGRGTVGVTHENIAGVKVLWSKKQDRYTISDNFDDLKEQNENLYSEVAKLKNDLNRILPVAMNGTNGKNGANSHTETIKDSSNFNWRLQAGLWTWQAGSSGNLLSPSLSLNIIIDKTSFIIQAGVTPWHKSTLLGNQSDSFVYAGVKHMKTDYVGFSLGGFRGWQFFTSTDDWSFKTTGVAAGIVFRYKKIEFNPNVTFSNIDSLDKSSRWKVGSGIGVNFNFN